MDICLRLFNMTQSSELNDVVIFQNNTHSDFESLSIAWKVIRRCGYANYHPFTYTTEAEVSASDSYGNFTPHLRALPGQRFRVFLSPGGNQLASAGNLQGSDEIVVANNLERGAISANIFKSGKLFARKTMVAPGQQAVFRFKPTLLLSACKGITESQGLEAAVMDAHTTELSLLGVASADIIMSGGGPDQHATPFRFHLENITWA